MKTKNIFGLIAILALLAGPFLGGVREARAAALTGGSLSLSDSRPSTTSVTYTANFDNVTTSTIKCIKMVFSDAATGGTVPTGLSTTSAALDAATDYIPTPGSWSADGSTTNGTVKITYATGEAPASGTDRTVVLTGITNGSVADTAYYLQFSTYNNADCSSDGVDSGIVTFIYTAGQAVSLTVDPSLTFTITGVASGQAVNGPNTTVATTTGTNTIPLGTVTTIANAVAAHDLNVATNAGGGYTVFIRYTGKPRFGTTDNYIDDLATHTNASPGSFSAAGTEAFGYTTNDATLGTGTPGRFISDKWAAFSTDNYEVAYSAAATTATETTRVGYQVGVSGSTPAGNYTTTVIFTATPTY